MTSIEFLGRDFDDGIIWLWRHGYARAMHISQIPRSLNMIRQVTTIIVDDSGKMKSLDIQV